MENQIFELAYPVNTVQWDGHVISRSDDAAIDAELDILQSTGISQVMLSGYQLEEPSDFDMIEEAERIGRKLTMRGMRASQHHGLSATFAPIGTSQAETAERLQLAVEITAALQADSLVLHAGRIAGKHTSVDSVVNQYHEQVRTRGIEAVIEISAENIRRAGELAEKYGLKIALENLDRFEPLSNLELLPKLVDAINLDNVGYCLDTGHAHACGTNPVTWLKVMNQKLFTTHFHDNRGCPDRIRNSEGFISSSGIDEHMSPGFGTICWIDVINELRKINYKYAVTFETGGWPVEDTQDGYLHAVRFWRTCEKIAMGKRIDH